MKKVNYDAKLEHDFIKNYKVLQTFFDKRQITKVRVRRLPKRASVRCLPDSPPRLPSLASTRNPALRAQDHIPQSHTSAERSSAALACRGPAHGPLYIRTRNLDADMMCQQHVDVPKLCRAKPLDNLEFLQWIKRYFDLHFGGHEYNALERRGGKGAVPLKENDSGNKPAPKVAAVKNGAVRVATSSSSRPASAANKKAAVWSAVGA